MDSPEQHQQLLFLAIKCTVDFTDHMELYHVLRASATCRRLRRALIKEWTFRLAKLDPSGRCYHALLQGLSGAAVAKPHQAFRWNAGVHFSAMDVLALLLAKCVPMSLGRNSSSSSPSRSSLRHYSPIIGLAQPPCPTLQPDEWPWPLWCPRWAGSGHGPLTSLIPRFARFLATGVLAPTWMFFFAAEGVGEPVPCYSTITRRGMRGRPRIRLLCHGYARCALHEPGDRDGDPLSRFSAPLCRSFAHSVHETSRTVYRAQLACGSVVLVARLAAVLAGNAGWLHVALPVMFMSPSVSGGLLDRGCFRPRPVSVPEKAVACIGFVLALGPLFVARWCVYLMISGAIVNCISHNISNRAAARCNDGDLVGVGGGSGGGNGGGVVGGSNRVSGTGFGRFGVAGAPSRLFSRSSIGPRSTFFGNMRSAAGASNAPGCRGADYYRRVTVAAALPPVLWVLVSCCAVALLGELWMRWRRAGPTGLGGPPPMPPSLPLALARAALLVQLVCLATRCTVVWDNGRLRLRKRVAAASSAPSRLARLSINPLLPFRAPLMARFCTRIYCALCLCSWMILAFDFSLIALNT